MSSYFDKWDSEQRRIKSLPQGLVRQDAHREHELKLVWDITLCVESPGCPEDIRDAAYRIMLRYGVHSLPSTYGFAADNPDVESEDDEYRSVGNMSTELHTTFHALAERGLEGFSDNPILPLRNLFGEGEARRLDMALAAAGKTRKDIAVPEELVSELRGVERDVHRSEESVGWGIPDVAPEPTDRECGGPTDREHPTRVEAAQF